MVWLIIIFWKALALNNQQSNPKTGSRPLYQYEQLNVDLSLLSMVQIFDVDHRLTVLKDFYGAPGFLILIMIGDV